MNKEKKPCISASNTFRNGRFRIDGLLEVDVGNLQHYLASLRILHLRDELVEFVPHGLGGNTCGSAFEILKARSLIRHSSPCDRQQTRS